MGGIWGRQACGLFGMLTQPTHGCTADCGDQLLELLMLSCQCDFILSAPNSMLFLVEVTADFYFSLIQALALDPLVFCMFLELVLSLTFCLP